MRSMTADLQEHHNELQDYVHEWGKRQQRLLEMVSISPILPSSGNGIWQPQHVSIDECLSDLNGEGQTSSSNLKNEVLLTTSASEEAQSQIDGGGLRSMETRRIELVEHFEESLNGLKDLMNPMKEDLSAWLNTALEMLRGEMSALDMFERPQHSPNNKSLGLVSPKPAKLESDIDWTRSGGIRDLLHTVVDSDHFEAPSAFVIICNAIVMGFSADHRIKNLDDSESTVLIILETIFFVYYMIELILRMFHEGRRFFIGHDWRWNCFDFGLVLLAFADNVNSFVFEGDKRLVLNASFLRLLRLLKLTKLLRVVRIMKIFKNLRLILASLLGSMQALLWAFVLLIILCYMASILFVNLIASFLIENLNANKEVDSSLEFHIDENWGSVVRGMNSLFMAVSGGDDWFAIAKPLWEAGTFSYIAFVLFIGFFIIVILNIFSSLFVQSVMENKSKDETGIIDDWLAKKDELVVQLREIFCQMDDDADGMISLEEFVKHEDDPKLRAWADHLDIDISDSKHFFDDLSHGGKVRVDIETFVMGCIKMRGQAKQVDVLSVLQLCKQMEKKINEYQFCATGKTPEELPRQMRLQIEENMHVGNLLPILTHLCLTQEKILAATSSQAPPLPTVMQTPRAAVPLTAKPGVPLPPGATTQIIPRGEQETIDDCMDLEATEAKMKHRVDDLASIIKDITNLSK